MNPKTEALRAYVETEPEHLDYMLFEVPHLETGEMQVGVANGEVMVTTKKAREFIGTYRCFLCAKKVRVYDWLPACVLCVRCNVEVDATESRCMEGA
jgi:hypothetical protein